MDRMWQRVRKLVFLPRPPTPSHSPLCHPSCDEEVGLWEERGGAVGKRRVISHRWGGGGELGEGGVGREGGGREGVWQYWHMILHHGLPPLLWNLLSLSELSVRRPSCSTAPHCRQVQTSACNRQGETAAAARGMQGLVPLFSCRGWISLGCQLETSGSFLFLHWIAVSSLLSFALWQDAKCWCIRTWSVIGHRNRHERMISTCDFTQCCVATLSM